MHFMVTKPDIFSKGVMFYCLFILCVTFSVELHHVYYKYKVMPKTLSETLIVHLSSKTELYSNHNRRPFPLLLRGPRLNMIMFLKYVPMKCFFYSGISLFNSIFLSFFLFFSMFFLQMKNVSQISRSSLSPCQL